MSPFVAISIKTSINPKQPKVFGEKLSLSEIGSIFSTEVRNFKLWEMPKLFNLSFQKGDIFKIVTTLN